MSSETRGPSVVATPHWADAPVGRAGRVHVGAPPDQLAAEREGEMRRLLLGAVLAGSLLMVAELSLGLADAEPAWRVVPLIAALLGFAAAVIAWLRTSPFTVRLLRVAMVPLLALGVLGLWLVHQTGLLVLLNLYSPLPGLRPQLVPVAATIPAFAPPAAILLGLLGLLFTYRHPLLR